MRCDEMRWDVLNGSARLLRIDLRNVDLHFSIRNRHSKNVVTGNNVKSQVVLPKGYLRC